jgi:tetratricopeptide (TPR) repeat protein
MPEAAKHFEKALKIRPRNVETLGDYARELAIADEDHRDCSRAVELATQACQLTNWEDPERRAILGIALAARALELQQEGEFAQAILSYQKALQMNPEAGEETLNLALLLATCKEEKYRNPVAAVRLAEQGVRLMEPPGVNAWLVLATAYAGVGRYEAASEALEEAIRLAEGTPAEVIIPQLERQIDSYQRPGSSPPSP